MRRQSNRRPILPFSQNAATLESPRSSYCQAKPLHSPVARNHGISTGNAKRDGGLRARDFFETEKYPVTTYRSTSLEPDGDGFLLRGDLTCHGVTAEVPLRLTLEGFGDARVAFTATGELNRTTFGVGIGLPLDGGGVVVGDKISVALAIQATLD
ncbi:YceI family protein [Amycolatopsis pigmentata]|uniref:YceI family protein n=1 Tax=Amycolatopsis pigmentata TaxID=450801 RepID=A0ABW5G4K7_9PSEU